MVLREGNANGDDSGTYDVNENEARLEGTSPVLRDTTMLYRYDLKTTPGLNAGWRAWRLRVDQPGVWMIHCHVCVLSFHYFNQDNTSNQMLTE